MALPTFQQNSSSSETPVAFVTGGASRIGRAVALQLAQAGFDIAFTHHEHRQAAVNVAEEITALGRRCEKFQVDFAVPDAVAELKSRFLETFSRVDVLVNNASVFAGQALRDLTAEDFDHSMRINTLAPILLIQAFCDLLGARFVAEEPASAGRIVNFVDIHVLGEPLPGFLGYNASKAALLEATKTLAVELAPRVTVNAIAPGVIGWADFHTAEYKQAFMQRVPLAREGTPVEAAKAVLFLVRDGTYCNGQVIRIDGGRLLT